mgnify:CR=1 FL=1
MPHAAQVRIFTFWYNSMPTQSGIRQLPDPSGIFPLPYASCKPRNKISPVLHLLATKVQYSWDKVFEDGSKLEL